MATPGSSRYSVATTTSTCGAKDIGHVGGLGRELIFDVLSDALSEDEVGF